MNDIIFIEKQIALMNNIINIHSEIKNVSNWFKEKYKKI